MLMRVAAAVAALSLLSPAQAECTATSGATTAALVELYTSEGCDSCPPADAWLRKLPSSGAGELVPLAFHVDYWDYIGWKDPFASPAFGARQRELAAVQRNRVVYTPQVTLGGRDYRQWSNAARFSADVRAVNTTPARADISLTVAGAQANAIRVSTAVPRIEDRTDAALYIAVYENGLVNRVTTGENRGVTLHHDFVVREWWGPIALERTGTAELVRTSGRSVANGGVAAFVQSRRTGEVLQALALPACKG